jgi:hypothetical protein
LPTPEELKAQLDPAVKQVAEAEQRVRRLEADYLRDHSQVPELRAALAELAQARHDLRERWKELSTPLEAILLDQKQAKDALDAANTRLTLVRNRNTTGEATADQLAAAQEALKQASAVHSAATAVSEKYESLLAMHRQNVQNERDDKQLTREPPETPSDSELKMHPDVALACLEFETHLKLDYVRFDDLGLWFKAALRVREPAGVYHAGDLIVVYNGRLLDSLDLMAAALKNLKHGHSFFLPGGLSGRHRLTGFGWSNPEEWLKPGPISRAVVHFELRVRKDGAAGMQARYPFGVCVSPEGLFVISVASKSLAAGEAIVAIEGHEGTASVVAADDERGLTLIKLNSPRERLFSWVKCRAGEPVVGQRFDFSKGPNTIFELAASAVNRSYPAPYSGDDAIVIEAPLDFVGDSAPLMAKDGELQGIVVASVPSHPNKDDPQTRVPDRHFAVPATRTQKLIDQYRANSAAARNAKRATDGAESGVP